MATTKTCRFSFGSKIHASLPLSTILPEEPKPETMGTETPPDVDIPMKSIDDLIHCSAAVCEDVGSGGTKAAPEAVMDMGHDLEVARVDEELSPQNPVQPGEPNTSHSSLRSPC